MNYKKKIVFIITALFALILITSCSELKLTEQMQAGVDVYIEAVSKHANKTAGKIKVISVSDDSAIEFKSTKSVIECEYTVNDGNVIYTRTDYLDGKKTSEYQCDGESVMCLVAGSSDWVDKTEENAVFLSADTNPLTTLSLFRVDNDFQVRTDYLTDIQYNSQPDENGYVTVRFTLKDSTVSNVLSYNKVKGIVRSSAGHTRTYYIDGDGDIAKIVVSAVQKILNNGKEGYYTTEITVLCE